jgi:uncharacterized membrane protein (UPF0127 family)
MKPAPLTGGCSLALPTPPSWVASGTDVPWLVRDGDVLAACEDATSFGARLKGLLGRNGLDGALVLRPARSVHTLGMRFPIDVAFCDRDLRVLSTCTMPRHRLGRPRWKAKVVIEAEAGAFERWGVQPGDTVELRETDDREGDPHGQRASG